MQAEQRHGLILAALGAEGRVDISDMSAQLAVSEMTIRRDLAALEADGALKRVHGGAVRVPNGSYEAPFAVRMRLNHDRKMRIAEAVSTQLSDGQTVVVDGGTSGLAVAEVLATRVLTICPLSMRAAAVLSNSRTARLLVPGGFVRPIEQSFVGAETLHALAQHVFDAFVMTASGLSIAAGVTEWNPEDAPVKRAALASSSRCIVACDSTKLGQTAFTRVADLNVIDLLVTDNDADPTLISEIEQLGIEVLVVDLEARSEQFAT